MIFLHELFGGPGGGQSSGAQAVVAAAVAIGPGGELVFHRAGGLLAQAGESVVFAQIGNHRFAAAPGSHEGSGNAGKTGFHRKAQLTGGLFQTFRRLVFFHARFGIAPDFIADSVEKLLFFLDGLADELFFVHVGSLLYIV